MQKTAHRFLTKKAHFMFRVTPPAYLSALLALASTPALAAGQLPKGVTPIHYDITIRPNAEKLSFTGAEVIKITVDAPTSTITLNAADLDIHRATLDTDDAAAFKVDNSAQTVTVSFAKPVSAGDHILAFDFAGKINTSAAGFFALDYKTDDGKDARMLATQFEAPDARRFAPMWDEPGYKATFRLSTIAPNGQTAFSNMPVDKASKIDGGTLYRFAVTPKMSSYLLFLGMGDVERKTKMVGKVEVGIITRRGVVDQGDYALNSAVRIIDYYNDYFGTPYPLPKLDMIAGPGSSQFFGAMENWGAILYFERRVLIDPKLATENQRQDVYTTVGHEIAHQWFGNLVTMAWWDDLWLNEGFASWMESKISNDLNPDWRVHSQSVSGGRQGAMNLDARETTHPIVQKIETVEQTSQAFDTITYQKGEAVIAMLEATLGEKAFRDGVRSYMQKYAYKNTVTDQLWDELAAASGQPVAAMMKSFTSQGGVPMIKVDLPRCVEGKTQVNLSQVRYGLDGPSQRQRTWQVPVAIGLAGGTEVPLDRVTVSGAKATLATMPGCGVPIVNYGQSGYFRTLYSPIHFSLLKEKFAKIGVDDQLGLIADSMAMAIGNYSPVGQHLDLIATVPEDASPLVWSLAARQIADLDFLMNGRPEQVAFRRRTAALLASVYKKLGWEAQAGEEPTVTQLRERVIPLMAQLGDAATVSEAKRYLDLSFETPDAVSGAVRLTALRAYARNADEAGWNTLRSRAKSETSPVAQSIYYEAIGHANNETLARKALAIALTDEAPVPVRTSIIASVAAEHPALAFDWAVKNKKDVNAILEESSRSEFIVGLADSGSDTALAKRVTAFASANLPASARAPARRTVNFITSRAARKARMAPAIGAWAKGTSK
jgi:aminopeptidase N